MMCRRTIQTVTPRPGSSVNQQRDQSRPAYKAGTAEKGLMKYLEIRHYIVDHNVVEVYPSTQKLIRVII